MLKYNKVGFTFLVAGEGLAVEKLLDSRAGDLAVVERGLAVVRLALFLEKSSLSCMRGFLLPTWAKEQGGETGFGGRVVVICTLRGFLLPNWAEGQGGETGLREGWKEAGGDIYLERVLASNLG